MGGLWGVLGTSLRVFAVSWGTLWGAWGPLGHLLGGLWGLLGTSWGVFGASEGPLGVSWGPLEVPWADFGSLLGNLSGLFGTLCGIFGVIGGVFGAFWGPSGCQNVPQRAPRASQMSENSLSECIAFLIAFLMHFGKDFHSFFVSRAQVRVCRNRLNYIGFRRFFASRLFSEPVGAPKQRSLQISPKNNGKSVLNTQKNDGKTRSELFWISLGSLGGISVTSWVRTSPKSSKMVSGGGEPLRGGGGGLAWP